MVDESVDEMCFYFLIDYTYLINNQSKNGVFNHKNTRMIFTLYISLFIIYTEYYILINFIDVRHLLINVISESFTPIILFFFQYRLRICVDY